MPLSLRCRCGQVRGELLTDKAYTRATCYCRDCRAYARWLGSEGVLDAAGGTDIVPMAPDGVRIEAGVDRVACYSHGPRGLLRWYAACCRTPLGNTPRDPKVHYVGMVPACIDAAPAAVDAAFGPRDRIVLNAGSATAPVRATPLRFLAGGLRIFAGIASARLRARRASPFFDPQGRPVREPELPDRAARAALYEDAGDRRD